MTRMLKQLTQVQTNTARMSESAATTPPSTRDYASEAKQRRIDRVIDLLPKMSPGDNIEQFLALFENLITQENISGDRWK